MYRVVSATAHSDCLEVDRNKFLSCVRRLAASLVFSIRAARASVRLSREILAYFYYHYASHDETPLSANTRSHGCRGRGLFLHWIWNCDGGGRPFGDVTVGAWRFLENDVRLTVSAAGSHQKLVQSFERRCHGRTYDKRLVTFITDAVCSLGLVEANSAACSLALQLETSSSTAARQAFVASAGGCLYGQALKVDLVNVQWRKIKWWATWFVS